MNLVCKICNKKFKLGQSLITHIKNVHKISIDEYLSEYDHGSCKCGCGRKVKPGREFIHGHQFKGKHLSDDAKNKIGDANRGRKHSAESSEKKRVAGLQRKHTEEERKKISESNKKSWANNPERKQKLIEFNKNQIYTDERKQKWKESRSGWSPSEETRKIWSINRSGENNPNWRGGKSFEEYCPMWIDLEYKNDLMERDDFKCQNPDCWGKSKKLCLHHIDYNKQNCCPSNLITLCYSCNTRANFNREKWQEIYSNIIREIYEKF